MNRKDFRPNNSSSSISDKARKQIQKEKQYPYEVEYKINRGGITRNEIEVATSKKDAESWKYNIEKQAEHTGVVKSSIHIKKNPNYKKEKSSKGVYVLAVKVKNRKTQMFTFKNKTDMLKAEREIKKIDGVQETIHSVNRKNL